MPPKSNMFFSRHCFEFTILILSILFYLINVQIPLMSDDTLYSFIFPSTPLEHTPWGINSDSPVRNLHDIFESQYNHYFLHGGRTPVHIIVQIFCALLGKNLYNIITTIFFCLFIYSLGKISMGPKKGAEKALYFIPFTVFYLFIIHPKCFYGTIAAGVNYLWSSVICLLMWYIFTQKENIHKLAIIPAFILCFVAGWSHEGIVIPLSIALASFWVFEVRKIQHWKTAAIIIFGIGAFLLVVAPGNFVRAGNPNLSLRRIIKFFLLFRVFYILILTLLYTYWKQGKQETKLWIFQNRHLIIGLIFSLPIFIYIGPGAPRVGYGLELISAILFGSLINVNIARIKSNTTFTYIIRFCTIIPILAFSAVLYYQSIASEQITNMINRIETDKENVVYIQAENKIPFLFHRFVQKYSAKEAPTWIKSVWEFKYNKKIEFIGF